MSSHKHFELISFLQTKTGTSFYSLENLLDSYARSYPKDRKGLELLTLAVFSEGPIEDSFIDEIITHLKTQKKH